MKQEKGVDSALIRNQYDDFDRIPVLLKRFSFEEKMRIACTYSSRVIKYDTSSFQKSRDPFPWSIEVFVMFSIVAQEYGNDVFQHKNTGKFIQICEAIWRKTSNIAEMHCENLSLLDLFLVTAGLTQSEFQEMNLIKEYRYWRLFQNSNPAVSLNQVFRKEMGTAYEDFLLFGDLLRSVFFAQAKSPNKIIPQKVLKYLVYVRFPVVAKHLTISRDNYISKLDSFLKGSHDPEKYLYMVSPSAQYPLVLEKNKVYFPLPHLLMRSVTSSLLYRITEGNNALREKIGKYILEDYLFDVINNSGIYNEACRECKYRHSGSESSSPDVIARHGKSVLFLESKSTVPSLGIRLLEPQAIKSHIKNVSGYMVQLYKQILRFDRYNPFQGEVSKDLDDYWGVVVVLEDSYVPRKHYYEYAKEVLQLIDVKWEWFLRHIKVTSLYEIERLSFTGKSVVDACKFMITEDPYNYPFVGYPKIATPIQNSEVCMFKDAMDSKAYGILSEMNSAGCFEHN